MHAVRRVLAHDKREQPKAHLVPAHARPTRERRKHGVCVWNGNMARGWHRRRGGGRGTDRPRTCIMSTLLRSSRTVSFGSNSIHSLTSVRCTSRSSSCLPHPPSFAIMPCSKKKEGGGRAQPRRLA
eukprot:2301156-Rhodomonas_salina.2